MRNEWRWDTHTHSHSHTQGKVTRMRLMRWWPFSQSHDHEEEYALHLSSSHNCKLGSPWYQSLGEDGSSRMPFKSPGIHPRARVKSSVCSSLFVHPGWIEERMYLWVTGSMEGLSCPWSIQTLFLLSQVTRSVQWGRVMQLNDSVESEYKVTSREEAGKNHSQFIHSLGSGGKGKMETSEEIRAKWRRKCRKIRRQSEKVNK